MAASVVDCHQFANHTNSRQLRRPDSKKNGSAFSEQPAFSGETVAFLFVRNEVEGSASTAKKLSAFFVSASVDRRARYCTVETRGKAEVPTALIVAITLAFAIGAQARRWAGRPHRAELHMPPAACALKTGTM